MEVRYKPERSLVPTNFNSPLNTLDYSYCYLLLALKALGKVPGTQRES